MKKLVLSILTVLFISLAVQAKPAKFDFEGVIKESGVDTESIAVSIKSADSGKIAYSLNDKMLMNPASVQKLLTTPVSVEILGEDYEFKTEIYSRGDEQPKYILMTEFLIPKLGVKAGNGMMI